MEISTFVFLLKVLNQIDMSLYFYENNLFTEYIHLSVLTW